ncbi:MULTISPECIES: carbon starvation CstA family protein [unclassified Campylobacter]|uniref:carbon starvation CstA family protein n=1 Tax=unclassified Campylobacter TaxID=2593542 RepID=UPI001237C96F|nr:MULTISPECIES: carbon starvation CstA family protein [unclassified Campylobacter]KAA6224729.1 carbon starvation protein A [Campylobacter sp. LR185c]KAA6225726.1 carbon starvation protein A [Campylobacter sp. LR286c]KAA6225847.1 carbon starvation protein A [Campylobacter sp. LR196d]KAA6229699.1 carbon starvation protein A [Campylobacter sp. LR291e]KAA6230055.1 carbon starvation protein A [Campylobacter sp. LR264d]
MSSITNKILWLFIAVLGAFCFCYLALQNGETVSAIYLVVAAICIYAIGYRFYGRFVAYNVLGLDKNRATPAVTQDDGRDFVPTNKYVLFGHHFAAIAGAGPLVGPILAAQMGYLPSMLWLLVGGVLAGSVHDFVVLFISTRRNGRSLGEMIKDEMGTFTGGVAMVAIFGIMIIIIAILAMVVVKALADSPWGLFTIAMTIPIAIFMGLYMRFWRPGKVGEASVIGFILLLLSIYWGNDVANNPALAAYFTYDAPTLSLIVMAYGFIAAILPVWFLLAPRDYLSTFLKIGVIVLMAIAIIFVAPNLQMPKINPQYLDGTGPVFAGAWFPFLFITIACGAISGFHALISSGTTPKMLENETHALPVGYGSMLAESAVGIMALICASILQPGLYFAVNSSAALITSDVAQAAVVISEWGFKVTPEDINNLTQNIGEKTILSRTGGAPTFAIGVTLILHELLGGVDMMKFWYHFAILFEALFILTAVDAGTRACRFMVQDMLSHIYKPLGNIHNFWAGVLATLIGVACWGYFLYQGAIDPKGGIYTLWPLFGVSNQMLAGMALLLVTAILVKMGKARYTWVTLVPAIFVLVATLYGGIQKVLPYKEGDRVHNAVSHIAVAKVQGDKIEALKAQLASIQDEAEKAKIEKDLSIASQSKFANILNAVLCIFFMITTLLVIIACAGICFGKIKIPLKENAYVKLDSIKNSQ